MRNLTLLVGVIAFQILFFQEQLGLNTLAFSVFALLAQASPEASPDPSRGGEKRGIFARLPFRLPSFGGVGGGFFILLSAAIILHNSLFAKIMWCVTFLVLVGLAQIPTIRLTYNALFHGFAAMLHAPLAVYRSGDDFDFGKMERIGKSLRWLRYTGLAFLILPIFIALYYAANADFAYLVDKFFSTLGDILASFSFEISWERVFSLLLGFGVVGAVVLPFSGLGMNETDSTDVLTRITAATRFAELKIQRFTQKVWHNPTSLVSEYRMGVVVLVLLNALLLLVNALDIRSVWFGIGAEVITKTGAELKADVHGSTYTLIFSIVLAISVVGYFFRGNLNFYTKNQKIMRLSQVWLLQNMFLAITLFVHNWHYISALGFAYKRLGVLAFLILIFIGLYTVFIKIKNGKTFYYLLRVNSWSVLIVLSLCALFDWDNIITNYNFANLNKTEAIDFDFLTSGMNSNKNLPTLWHYRTMMNAPQKSNLAHQLQEFRIHSPAKKYGFWSWNYNDVQMQAFYKTNIKAIDAFCAKFGAN